MEESKYTHHEVLQLLTMLHAEYCSHSQKCAILYDSIPSSFYAWMSCHTSSPDSQDRSWVCTPWLSSTTNTFSTLKNWTDVWQSLCNLLQYQLHLYFVDHLFSVDFVRNANIKNKFVWRAPTNALKSSKS